MLVIACKPFGARECFRLTQTTSSWISVSGQYVRQLGVASCRSMVDRAQQLASQAPDHGQAQHILAKK